MYVHFTYRTLKYDGGEPIAIGASSRAKKVALVLSKCSCLLTQCHCQILLYYNYKLLVCLKLKCLIVIDRLCPLHPSIHYIYLFY